MARALEARFSKDADPRPLPDARALWRQYRGHARGEPRLFRQGADAADASPRRRSSSRCRNRRRRAAPTATPTAARAARDRVLDRLAGAGVIDADAAAAAKTRAGAGGAPALPDARRPSRRGGGRRASRRCRSTRLTIDRDLQASLEALAADRAAAARAEALGRDRRRRSLAAATILASVGSAGLLRGRARRPCRHDAGAPLAGLDAEAADLRPRLRGGPRPSRKPDRGPADRLRRLCAAEFRRLPSRHRHHPRGADPVAQRAGDHRAQRGRAGAAGRAHEAGRASRRCSPTSRRPASPSASAASASRSATSSSSTRRSPAAAPRCALRDGVDDAAGRRRGRRAGAVADRRLVRRRHPRRHAAADQRLARPDRLQDRHLLRLSRRLGGRLRRRRRHRRLDRPAGRHAGARASPASSAPRRSCSRRSTASGQNRVAAASAAPAGVLVAARPPTLPRPLQPLPPPRRDGRRASRTIREIAFPLDGVEVDLGIKDGDPTPLIIKVRNGAPALHLLRQRRADRPRRPSTARKPGSRTARASSRSRWSTRPAGPTG